MRTFFFFHYQVTRSFCLSLCLPLSLSVCLAVCLSVCLSVCSLSLSLSLSLSPPSFIHMHTQKTLHVDDNLLRRKRHESFSLPGRFTFCLFVSLFVSFFLAVPLSLSFSLSLFLSPSPSLSLYLFKEKNPHFCP